MSNLRTPDGDTLMTRWGTAQTARPSLRTGSWEDNDPFIATGNKYGQPQTAVAGNQPRNSTSSDNGPSASGAVSGVRGLPQRTAGPELSIKDRLRAAVPNTANVADQSVGDATHAWKNGRRGEAAGHMLRGVAASIPAYINDVYNGLRPKVINPVEDAGRALFGMEDRKEPSATPVTPVAPVATAQPATKTIAEPAPGPQAVTPEDHTASDRLINSAFYNRPRTGMATVHGADGKPYEVYDEGNMNTLRMDGSSLKKYNAGLAERGAGIQVTKDANGQLRLSNSTGPEKLRYVGADGVPTNQYERTDQYAQGMQQLEAARATLRNPDGSTWSARDNAIMAANLRDGVDPYRGTSRAPKNDEHAQVRALASSPVGTIGRRGAMRRMAEIEQNQTTQRGQDQDMERDRLTAQSTLRKNEFDMNRDIRKDAREQETHAQAVGDKAREGFVKEFGAFNPDGTPNQGLTAAKISAMQRLFPGIDMTSPEGRSKHLPDAQSTAKIYERIASNPQMGMDKLITAKGPGYDAMPDWKGATLKQQGYVGGKLTPGSEPNGWYITHNGVDTPLGADLSQRELEIIRHATKTGSWRGAPKNTQ